MSSEPSFLPHFIDEEIYVVTDSTKESVPTKNTSIESKTYIVTNEVSLDNQSSELAILLNKILSAVQLDLSKVVLTEQLHEDAAGKIILFGDITMKEKYTLEHEGTQTILRADFLRTIAVSADLKKALWGALKQLF